MKFESEGTNFQSSERTNQNNKTFADSLKNLIKFKMEQKPEIDERVFLLKDLKTMPDIVHEYTSKEAKVPLIIDNGSFQSRVGFSCHKKPQLVFRNLVAKPRKDRNKKETKEELQNVQPMTLIGNDILNIEAMRFQVSRHRSKRSIVVISCGFLSWQQLRTQFDRNVVTHFYLQEQIFDYIFTHLGINTAGAVNHPIVITEPVVNPNYCRACESHHHPVKNHFNNSCF